MTKSKPHARFDTYRGKVIAKGGSGIYLQFENGEEAFAFSFSSLLIGTPVFCSILRNASGDKKTLVSIDSTLIA